MLTLKVLAILNTFKGGEFKIIKYIQLINTQLQVNDIFRVLIIHKNERKFK